MDKESIKEKDVDNVTSDLVTENEVKLILNKEVEICKENKQKLKTAQEVNKSAASIPVDVLQTTIEGKGITKEEYEEIHIKQDLLRDTTS